MSVSDEIALRKRVSRFFSEELTAVERRLNNTKRSVTRSNAEQMRFDFLSAHPVPDNFTTHKNNVVELLDVLRRTVPEGGVYLFGGLLRDFALFGRQGFNSDIDIVIDGDFGEASRLLLGMGARRNKFGGFRLTHRHKNLPIDIWSARETWAIKQGYVEFNGISSLLNTTVLNWDAILMNWETKSFICGSNYFEDISNRYVDIVLEYNPNPLGMYVRVLRHILLKDAKKVSYAVSKYLSKYAQQFEFEDVQQAEYRSYGNSYIHKKIYESFKELSLIIDVECGEEGICVESVANPTLRMVT